MNLLVMGQAQCNLDRFRGGLVVRRADWATLWRLAHALWAHLSHGCLQLVPRHPQAQEGERHRPLRHALRWLLLHAERHGLPFLVCCIGALRVPLLFLVELGAAISVASTTVPVRSAENP